MNHNSHPSHPSHRSEDDSRRAFLQMLDGASLEVTDWEAKFIESCMNQRNYTPRQREKIDQMRKEYEHRL